MQWLDGITNSVDMSLSKLWEIGQGRVACCSQWGDKDSDMTQRLNNSKGSAWTLTPGKAEGSVEMFPGR